MDTGTHIGAILSQNQEDGHLHTIAYYSRKLKPAETRYSTLEQEALSDVGPFRIVAKPSPVNVEIRLINKPFGKTRVGHVEQIRKGFIRSSSYEGRLETEETDDEERGTDGPREAKSRLSAETGLNENTD